MNLKVYLPQGHVRLTWPKVLFNCTMAKKILIVEDNIAIAENIFDFLELAGFEPCSIAKNYEEAVAQFEDYRPDFAILDINLEGERTGIDVAKFIRGNSNMPFIYYSAAIEPQTLERAKTTKPFAFIPKPIEFSNLKATIDAALGGNSNKNILQISILDRIGFLIAPSLTA